MTQQPELPLNPAQDNGRWSDNMHEAYDRISSICDAASSILTQEADPNRIQIHLERVVGEAVPILLAVEEASAAEGLPSDWLLEYTEYIAALANNLADAQHGARTMEDSHIHYAQPVTTEHTDSVYGGRPRKNIDVGFLREAMAMKRRISLAELARHLGVSVWTVRRRLKEAGVYHKFSSISDHDLDDLVRAYRRVKPNAGLRYVIGFLRGHDFRIQGSRIIKSMRRVDRLGGLLHKKPRIKRRTYRVKRPNALWHLDGHHKLILWGIVIHGIVDGYCRTITGLRASTNNRAATVLDVFLDAVDQFGHPSRVRGDRGRENKAVAIYIILKNGLNRGSFIWGSSTHNTRIERLWVEVGSQFARRWRAFFYRLEDIHCLNRSNPHHLWLIHHLFLGLINEDCKTFQTEWNVHPISGEEGKNESPHDKRWLGMLTQGIYTDDDCSGLDIDTIEDLYGADGQPASHPPTHTGAGFLADEDVPPLPTPSESGNSSDDSDSDSESELGHLEGHIGNLADAQSSQFLPKKVKTPRHVCPFTDEELELFDETLREAGDKDILPYGYGIHPEEWRENHYPTVEIIRTGRKGGKELSVRLPEFIWRPRAHLWTLGLSIMDRMLESQE